MISAIVFLVIFSLTSVAAAKKKEKGGLWIVGRTLAMTVVATVLLSIAWETFAYIGQNR